MVNSITPNVTVMERDESLDSLQGLLIVYMIMVHSFQWANIKGDSFNEVASYVMFFFMPWFFYKSGMFHKEMRNIDLLKKLTKKLLIPYIIFSFAGEIIHWLILYEKGVLSVEQVIIQPLKEILLWGSVSGNMPLWFLLSFFAVKIIISLADQMGIKKLYVFLIAVIFSGGGDCCDALC